MMEDCNPIGTPLASRMKFQADCPSPLLNATIYRSPVGSVLYLTDNQPNIAFVVNMCTWYMKEPHENHWQAIKGILCYMRGTTHMSIHYSTKASFRLKESLTLIRFVILMGVVPLVIYLLLVLDQFPSVLRSNNLCLSSTKINYTSVVLTGKYLA